nr:acanthoscurrin-2-like [Arachis hypogaea]
MQGGGEGGRRVGRGGAGAMGGGVGWGGASGGGGLGRARLVGVGVGGGRVVVIQPLQHKSVALRERGGVGLGGGGVSGVGVVDCGGGSEGAESGWGGVELVLGVAVMVV